MFIKRALTELLQQKPQFANILLGDDNAAGHNAHLNGLVDAKAGFIQPLAGQVNSRNGIIAAVRSVADFKVAFWDDDFIKGGLWNKRPAIRAHRQ